MLTIIYTLLVTHITIVAVTLYLHRAQAHKSVVFHSALQHFFRAWIWLTTGMVTKQWVAIHRKHHRFTDTSQDPHSPITRGIWRVLFGGALLYHKASRDTKMINAYGAGTPNDWIERNIYTPHSRLGIGLMLLFNVVCFGWWGMVVWLVQMLWIPFWAAGVINGLAHWAGYRNGETKDNSRNIVPWGIIVGGEELHNNHHLDPGSAKLSRKSWEFDLGWFYIRWLCALGLAKLTRPHAAL